jgi:Amt family ammonium transporter
LCVGLFAEPEIMKSRGLDPAKFKGGLFFGGGMDQLIAQLTGVVATAVYVMLASAVCWAIIKATIGMRVSKEEEIEGLDIGEHGNEAYHGFVIQQDNA